jgi:hypothetical protein
LRSSPIEELAREALQFDRTHAEPEPRELGPGGIVSMPVNGLRPYRFFKPASFLAPTRLLSTATTRSSHSSLWSDRVRIVAAAEINF